MDDDTLGGLMAEIEQIGDPVEGAQTWIDENRNLIDEWVAAGDAD
jgi:glycine betaine/proline transport system substrate-binding protein